MAFSFFATPATGAPGEVHTSAQNLVGALARSNEGHEYIYLSGVAATAAGSWVTYDEAGVTALIDTDVADSIIGSVAIATAATVASTWGWYGRRGTFTAVVLASLADNAKLFATATAGAVDDTSVAGSQIVGGKARSAEAGGFATVQIDEPVIGVNVA